MSEKKEKSEIMELSSDEKIMLERFIDGLVYRGLKPLEIMKELDLDSSQYYMYMGKFGESIFREFRIVKQELRMGAMRKLMERVDEGNVQAINIALRETSDVDWRDSADKARGVMAQQINIYMPEKEEIGGKEVVVVESKE